MFFVILILQMTATIVSADVTSVDIRKALTANMEHPYLFFSEKDKPEILDRIENDPASSEIFAQLLAEANRLLYTPVGPMPKLDSPNGHFLGENEYSQYLTNNVAMALKLAFVYQMTGDQKYADRAFEFADAVSHLPTWVHTVYEGFPVVYTRVWPWNVDDDQVNFTFNHRAGNYTRDMASVYDWLYPALDKRQRDRIRSGLIENAITRVRGNYEYHWWASSYRCNWCGVCNSGLGVAAFALLTEDPHLTDVVAESYNRIGKMLDEIGEGGGWQEGCGYWNYGLFTSLFFADTLNRLTDGTYNLFDHEKIRNNTINCALFNFLPPNKTVDFEDSGDGIVGNTWFYNKLAAETGSREAAWYRENNFGKGTSLYDIIWPDTDVKPGLPKQASHFFNTINWAVLRSDFTDTEKVVIACKAGYNDDPHHGHLDCGHFILNWRGENYLSEPLKSGYDIFYFQKERWDYPHASSIGHNVVLVNGEKQIPARIKDQPWLEGIGGDITKFIPGESRDYVCMDPTGAYPNKELKKWRRHIVLDKPDVTVIVDEVKADRGSEIETRFHSRVKQKLRDGYMLLDGERGNMALIPVTAGNYHIWEGRHPLLAMSVNDTFKWSPYFGTVITADDDYSIIATIIAPVESTVDAEAIIKTIHNTHNRNDYSLSFTFNGRNYRYEFESKDDGLELSSAVK